VDNVSQVRETRRRKRAARDIRFKSAKVRYLICGVSLGGKYEKFAAGNGRRD